VYLYTITLSGELMLDIPGRQLFSIKEQDNRRRSMTKEEPMLVVREHCHHNAKILELSGHFDANSKLGLEVAILGANEMGCQHIVLNFSNITRIDSMGLGQLFLWYHNMRLKHVHLSIVSPQPTVKDLLESAHLSDIVPIYQSENEAMEAHATSPPAAC
jgi:anti-anti-sigma factor